jgi:hypothetical protein
VDVTVKAPSGGKSSPYVEDNGNGTIGVSYQPKEEGLHTLDVKHNGEHCQVRSFFYTFTSKGPMRSFKGRID